MELGKPTRPLERTIRPMDQGVPPPPGGYGLPPECGGGSEGPPPPRPNIIPPASPPVSPFRENYYVPPTSNPSGKRWAFGGIGAAILGVRLLLLCGRVADSGSDDYSYNPSSYPTYDPTAFGALFDASLVPSHSPSAQQIAVGADGRAYWLEGDQVTVQGHDSKDVLDPKALGKPIQGEFVPQYGATLVATDKSLLWAAGGRFDQGEVVSSIVAMPLAGGTPKVIVKNLVATPEGLTLDAQTLWFTEPGDQDARNLMRVSTSGGTPTKIASWSDPFELRETLALAVDVRVDLLGPAPQRDVRCPAPRAFVRRVVAHEARRPRRHATIERAVVAEIDDTRSLLAHEQEVRGALEPSQI